MPVERRLWGVQRSTAFCPGDWQLRAGFDAQDVKLSRQIYRQSRALLQARKSVGDPSV